MITFASHQARAGMAGASEDFEQMLGLLVRATCGEASLVFANPGDWGIDVLVGDLRGRVTIWQAKYFSRGVGRSQQGQISESFASALRNAARHGHTLERWVLCIPASMDGPTTRWWQGWKAERERDSGVAIGLWDETRLRELLLRPEAAHVRRHYYNPYRHDGHPDAAATAGASHPPAQGRPAPAGGEPCTRRRVTRRAVVIGAAGASAAGLLPATRGIFEDSVPVRKPAWTYPTGTYVACIPAVAGGVVYVGDGGGWVHALHAITGRPLWDKNAGGKYPIFTRPAVAGGTVYVGSSSYQGICALDIASYRSQRRIYPWGGEVNSGITIAGGVAYYGSMDYSVYAVDTAAGRLRWSFKTGLDVQSTPHLAGGTIYFGSEDRCVYALDAVTGQLRWKRATEGFILSSPAVAGGVVYIGSGDHLVYALSAADGRVIWICATGGEIRFSDPVIAGGTVYIGSMDRKVYALDAASGRIRWARSLGTRITGSPAVSAGTVYIGGKDGRFYALDAATGDIQWTYVTRGFIQRGPAVADGMVYTGSEDGNIYAFRTAPAT